MDSILAEVGGTRADVVKVNIYAMNALDYNLVNTLFGDAFDHPWPCRGFHNLIAGDIPEWSSILIELDFIAYVGG
jgi:enamine deaminase RidA (YjgF/YER057c/UK114 family)